MSSRRSLSKRVFATVFTVAITLIIVFTMAGAAIIQQRLYGTARNELAEEAAVVSASLNSSPSYVSMLRRLDLKNTRVTLVDPDGTVVYDSEKDPETMPNHALRPEIADALAKGTGSAERTSATLGETMLYEAVRLADGSVVRLAQDQDGYLAILVSFIGPLAVVAAACAIAAALAARHMSARIIEPLLEVDLDHPIRSSANAYAEMVPMLERIEDQRQELKRQMRVLADNDRMRREFTANITHELKTPLTAISGYAELIANDMVDSDDDRRDFARRIHGEAGRLTALVNDILTLSNLDEAEHAEAGTGSDALSALGGREPIDLSRTIESVAQRLESVAASAGVSIGCDASPAQIVGVARLIDELVYNLASNAIRYNKRGGSVALSCGIGDDGKPYVRVSDTGIGIAPEEQEKVFERFYRVDKSRSKARGGTGLGLAIVKHAAVFHEATIEMDSALGEGTEVTVRFPARKA